MTQQIKLTDVEPRSTKGSLHKYVRKSDKMPLLARSIVLPHGVTVENFPLIQNCETLSQHPHPNLAKYYGYAVEKENNSTKLLVFFESAEGTLADYLQKNRLTKNEVNILFEELVKVFIHVDRNAYSLPSYITPDHILVVKDNSGNKHFKLFNTVAYDEDYKITEEDLKWSAPELYERVKYQRKEIYINPEKAIFYSLAVLVLYSTTKEMITKERANISQANFATMIQERENKAIFNARTKFLSEIKDEKLNKLLGKLLVNVEKRPDFRIWQLRWQKAKAQDISVFSNQAADQTDGYRLDQSTHDGILIDSQSVLREGPVLEGKEKAACCETCNIF